MTNHDINANDGLMQDELTLEQLMAISRVESTWLISALRWGCFRMLLGRQAPGDCLSRLCIAFGACDRSSAISRRFLN